MTEVALRLYNTLSRRLEVFEPIESGRVRMYTCGPTVYDFAHIGNIRTFLFEDVLRRTLKHFGYDVTQVMNLTDIDDKTIREAQAAGLGIREYTDRFIEAFFTDLDTLRIERAEHYPRATDYIPQMVKLVQRLEAKGHAYRSDGSVYYSISTFPEYGKLSGIRPEANLAGARVDNEEYEKEDARDFVLWKGSREGEPSWDSEIGPGRPGWHLECSVMSIELLGEEFDIHTGGVDNIFPHHENEIAQSEGATGRPFAHLWLHAEHLVVEGEKMAKSKGNFYTLRDLLDRGHEPEVIRYLLISVPYRQKLNFTMDGLHAAEQAIDRIRNTLRRLDNTPAADGTGDLDAAAVIDFRDQFEGAIGDDLNTARALAALHGLLRHVNTALDGGGVSEEIRSLLQRAFEDVDSVLGIFPDTADETDDDDEIQRLVDERTAAREARDFGRADELRDRLTEMGIVVEDTPHGAVWHRKN
ncbi:MAG: cysteine--tRNA ligase [Acidobacteriota bacterium]